MTRKLIPGVRSALALCSVLLAGLLVLPTSATAATPKPFGHACSVEHGVRFCPTNELTDRVPTWDGVPLDVDVTLPLEGDGPFPTIVMDHPFPGTKNTFEHGMSIGTRGISVHYDNAFYAKRGYAVVNYSARGFGRSCGNPEARTAGCERGWTHISDHRFEVRDVQYLMGLLVDQGVAKADALGMTGTSGGGGRTISLAFLKDRIRQPDGSFARWKSPAGTPLKLAAAYARWGWYDLANGLMPNGRQSTNGDPTARSGNEPQGIVKELWADRLFAAGAAMAFVSPANVDPQSDITTWRAHTSREPYTNDVHTLRRTLSGFIGGAVGIPGDDSAPLLMEQGWTDELFGVDEALAVYRRLRSNKDAQVGMMLGDLGHPRGAINKKVQKEFSDRAAKFFDQHLKRGPQVIKPGVVRAHLTQCPQGTTGRLVYGKSFDRLQRGHVVVRSSRGKQQKFDWKGGSKAVANAAAHTESPCFTAQTRREPNTAWYEAKSKGFTLFGAAEVTAKIRSTGTNGQISARLWDVSGKEMRLISRGLYRLANKQQGTIRMQLYPNGYKVAAGHRVVLQLLGRDAQYAKAPGKPFTVTVDQMKLRLPVNDRPNSKRGVVR